MNKLISIKTIILLISFSLTGCAALTEQARQMECNTDAAYANGVNDAQKGSPMDITYASLCQSNIQTLNAAYRRGYMTMTRSKPADRSINIDVNSQEKRHNHNQSRRHSQWQCIDMPFKSVCGYGCIKTPFDQAYCGAKPGDRCVKNDFEQVKCGKHCHAEPMGTKIFCDIERYSKSSDRP